MRVLFTFLLFILSASVLSAQFPSATLKKALTAPVIDGIIDEGWTSANTYYIDRPFQNDTPTLGVPGTTTWKGMWTNEGLYFLVQVNDDIFFPLFLGLYSDQVWNYDKAELFLDVNADLKDGFGPPNDRSGYDNGHFMISSSLEVEKINGQSVKLNDGIEYAYRVTDPSYVAEYFIPFTKLINRKGHQVNKIATFGFDVTIIDKDSEWTPRQRLSWSNQGAKDESFYNMDDCGTFTLEDYTPEVFVDSIAVSSLTGIDTIDFDAARMQLTAEVFPSDATIPDVTWAISSGSDKAWITENGLLIARFDGKVTVTASSADGSGVTGSKEIIITNQFNTIGEFNILRDPDFSAGNVPATSPWKYESSTNGNASGGGGMCTMFRLTDSQPWWAKVSQSDLEVENGNSYLLTFTAWTYNPKRYFFVEIMDNSINGSELLGSSTDAMSNGRSRWQIPLTDMPVTFTFHVTIDNIKAGSNPTFVFIVPDSTESVLVKDVSLTNVVLPGNLGIPVSSIKVTNTQNASGVFSNMGTLQFKAQVFPANASIKDVTWGFYYGEAFGTLTKDGFFTAKRNGDVIVKATSKDGQNTEGIFQFSVSNQQYITEIQVFPETVIPVIQTNKGTLQLVAEVLPVDAAWKNVRWTVENGTGKASISSDGLLTAMANGTVTARAWSTDGGEIFGSIQITISNQVPVSSIIVRGAGNKTLINKFSESWLQMSAEVLPAQASYKDFVWSVENGTGMATIFQDGQFWANAEGTVTVKATSMDGSNTVGTLVITIDYGIQVNSISLSNPGGISSIFLDKGSLQMNAKVFPEGAYNKNITWVVFGHGGKASVTQDGLLTPEKQGKVIVCAASTDSTNIVGKMTITIIKAVESLSVYGTGGVTSIETGDETLQMQADVLPVDASIRNITWSVVNGTGKAVISPDGLLTAVADGTVTVYGKTTDGTEIIESCIITISNHVGVQTLVAKSVNVFPVPVENELTVSFEAQNATVAIYNLHGKKMTEQQAYGNLVKFDVSSFEHGIYIVKVNGFVSARFVK
jgi:uncharacterized protein YjdB